MTKKRAYFIPILLGLVVTKKEAPAGAPNIGLEGAGRCLRDQFKPNTASLKLEMI
ncbi:hypothetical protein GCM10011369_22640 [Neiella marina]|uniref:Uncharacterized protein n=1 Tax=Neiella marina TaxID=508461 RepID=A0A8J2U613_9GAMM|nr:hypothetical protein GCM10011369_22640 [Neiella marina]